MAHESKGKTHQDVHHPCVDAPMIIGQVDRVLSSLIVRVPERVINFKFLPQPHQKYYITQYGELGISYLTQMKDDYTTNSHYLTYTYLFRRLGECILFELRSERVIIA